MVAWFTSDQHFGHKNIINLSHRPFESVEEMNEELIRRWNERVSHNDLVFVLGDFTLSTQIMEKITPRLKGQKVLIPGNHDQCHSSKNYKHKDRYIRAHWRVQTEQLMIILAASPELLPVLLSHFPYRGDSQEYTERYKEYRPVDDGGWLLHGHVHEAWKVRDKMINVGVDVWDYAPVSEFELTKLIKDHVPSNSR